MDDVGKLTLGVFWDGDTVSTIDIRSTRPMAAQILKGKTPEQVARIVPLLFSVCGRAQGAAANAALQAAQQGSGAASATVEHMIVCEAMQEHLWRLMLDWTKLMGLPRQEQRFAGWYALLRKIGAGEIGMDVFLREFERDCLEMPVAEWRALGDYQALQTWSLKVHSPSAQVLSRLDELERGRHKVSDSRLLPAWTAAEAGRACEGRWDMDFSACPDWLGDTAETGAWTYYADDGLLHDVWQQSRSKVLSRLLARVIDVIAMASGTSAPRLDAASPEANIGIAVVRTARGLLMHHVRLEGDLVADYAIVAPTEWNFHPDGPYARDMRGLKERDPERLQQLAHVAALSLDPCVAYEVEIHHA
ncbi:nickel-dependent hydrogenase large subunit [Sideroxydans sp. CL21]|uniref:nickel-dependent hydrogenase large subunit n=1 Tax=Sideroxydans sp. CL21 TaxID=2600596 RepID=UPI0024BC77C4|nr:nickel-dependent hydrogenase large subunit [Sideroxydans sp. CL21]